MFFYKHILKFDEDKAGITRETFFLLLWKAELMPIELRESEGINISFGYVKPIHLLPIFQKQIAIGKSRISFLSQSTIILPLNYQKRIMSQIVKNSILRH